MSPAFQIYTGAWMLAVALAVGLLVAQPKRHALLSADYRRFLGEPWKLVAFALGGGLITFIAPYTDDPTWDRVNGFFMSVLCFATAPWTVGVLYRAARRRAGAAEVYVALCAWFLTASWSYDIYLFWRDGEYPLTWLPNLYASSLIYLCAGLFWNLEWRPDRGVIFSFMRPDWPAPSPSAAPLRLFFYALLLAVPALWATWLVLPCIPVLSCPS